MRICCVSPTLLAEEKEEEEEENEENEEEEEEEEEKEEEDLEMRAPQISMDAALKHAYIEARLKREATDTNAHRNMQIVI